MTKLRTLLLIAGLALLPLEGWTRDVSGRVWEVSGESRIVAKAARVTVKCGERRKSATAGDDGRYELVSPDTGPCSISVSYKGKGSRSLSISITDSGVRANLELRIANGRWSLKKT